MLTPRRTFCYRQCWVRRANFFDQSINQIRAGAPRYLPSPCIPARPKPQKPAESVRELIEAGIARILVPSRFGGDRLDLEIGRNVEMSHVRRATTLCQATADAY